MKIKLGNTRIDLFGGNLTEIVFLARELSLAPMLVGQDRFKGYKSTGTGKVKKLGEDRYTPTGLDIAIKQLLNKQNPAMSLFTNMIGSGLDKQGQTIDDYGKEYSLGGQLLETLTPIYWGNLPAYGANRIAKNQFGVDLPFGEKAQGTLAELIDDKQANFDMLSLMTLGGLGFFGLGVNTYDPPKSKGRKK